jgi:3-hydroxyisobutyrate dehydrogenase-like beta-hydroxyacid dehydrogenase
LEAVNQALFQSPFIANYGSIMLNPPQKATVTVTLGAKDMRLFREAASSVPAPLAELFASQLHAAIEAGFGDADWAGGLYDFLQQQPKGALPR